jgi:hypothetical protein
VTARKSGLTAPLGMLEAAALPNETWQEEIKTERLLTQFAKDKADTRLPVMRRYLVNDKDPGRPTIMSHLTD